MQDALVQDCQDHSDQGECRSQFTVHIHTPLSQILTTKTKSVEKPKTADLFGVNISLNSALAMVALEVIVRHVHVV